MKLIGIEEHYLTADVRNAWEAVGLAATDPSVAVHSGEIERRLLDLANDRLALMDETGLDVQVLSLTTPALHDLGRGSVDLARRANDAVAQAAARWPDRFQALAALPVAMPDEAALELDRCVRTLGFKGTMLCGRVGDRNLDGSLAIFGDGRVKRPIGSVGSLRCREIKLFADKLDHLGEGRGVKTEGALDNAGCAANVTRDVEGRCLSLAKRPHHLEALDRCISRLQRFEAADRPNQLLELAVVSLDDVVQILDMSMQRRIRAFAFLLQRGQGDGVGRRMVPEGHFDREPRPCRRNALACRGRLRNHKGRTRPRSQ
jgi:hypothetical protein